jgi:Caspase domain
MMRHWMVLPLLLCILPGEQVAAQTKRALVIGINTYQPEGTDAQHPIGCTYGRCELGRFENLQGAVNDAQSMADLLTSPKFGFPANQVFLLTNPAPPQPRTGIVVLPAILTARNGILAAMQKYLVDVPEPGDTVVFYDASHGSLRINSKGNKLTVLFNGEYIHADSTIVPADAYKGGYDVRDREMTRIFDSALDKGIHLTVIFDTCYSGGSVRGVGPKYRERSLAFDPRDINEAPDVLTNGQLRPSPTERKDNPALVFSASQQDQSAIESPPPDIFTEPHGAFTAALLEALEVLPANAPSSVIYQRVKAVLEGSGVPDQEPDLDATAARRQQPLFGGVAADSGKVTTAALSTGNDGSVLLDIGRVSGIGIGSEFTSTIKDAQSRSIKLRITDFSGIARSGAEIISPLGAKIAPGEIFELTKWVQAAPAPLLFWLWPSNLSEDNILAATAEIRTAGVTSVSDPAEEPWTDILCWDGTNWTLQHAGAPQAISLGTHVTAGALREHLRVDAKLWANLPPPMELAARLTLHERDSAVQPARDLAGADYILTGVLTGHGSAYAWFHKNEFAAGPRKAVTTDHSPGCSTTSQYPVRSDWVSLADATRVDDDAKYLNENASVLARVHGWLQLADSPTGASTANYYKLALLKASDETPWPTDQPARTDVQLKMVLQSDDRIIEKRWVYVLDIDCHGKGSLFYPGDYSENRFPNDADGEPQFLLPHADTLRIGPPYGVETLILLSTADPLPDPSLLSFEGAARRGPRGADSALQRLLTDTNSGTRGLQAEIPTNWGLDWITIRSIPKGPVK